MRLSLLGPLDLKYDVTHGSRKLWFQQLRKSNVKLHCNTQNHNIFI